SSLAAARTAWHAWPPRRRLPSFSIRCSAFFFKRSGAHRDLHSFPTRRSSDLRRPAHLSPADRARESPHGPRPPRSHGGSAPGIRSEEHTSELQSRGHLVCRLLLEKKNITTDFDAHALHTPSTLRHLREVQTVR